jgi:release factor glutamine methyltransferase
MVSLGKKVFFSNYVFNVVEDVYEPAEDSFLFAENLRVSEGDVVLDMGTGCGILGMVAAGKAARVVAVDVNPFAVRCAKENARLNGVSDRFLFVWSDLFSAFRVGVGFDVVLFNAPYLPSEGVEGGSWVERAWSGGKGGREVIDRFIGEVSKYLVCGGVVFLMQSTLAGFDETKRKFVENGFGVDVVARCDLPFETVVLFRAKR